MNYVYNNSNAEKDKALKKRILDEDKLRQYCNL